MKKEYCKKGDKGPTTTVYIEEEAISLSLTTDSGVTEVNRLGWELTLLVQPPTVSYIAMYCSINTVNISSAAEKYFR